MKHFAALFLFVSGAHAFAPGGLTTLKQTRFPALNAQRYYGKELPSGATGGIDGSSLVSGRRVDIDAPWGGSRTYPNELDVNRNRASKNERSFPWGSTGGNSGSTLVSQGRVDVDAPWGANHPTRPDARYYHASLHTSVPSSGTTPGTTGGIAGSSLVAAGRIDPNSAYAGNFHRLHSAGKRKGEVESHYQQEQQQRHHQLPASRQMPYPTPRRVAPQQQQQQRQMQGVRR